MALHGWKHGHTIARLGMTLEPLLGSTALNRADVSWNTSSGLSGYGAKSLVSRGHITTHHVNRVARPGVESCKSLPTGKVKPLPMHWGTQLRSVALTGTHRRCSYEDKSRCSPHRATSLMRKRIPLGPYRKPVPRVIGGSQGVGRFLMGEVPLYHTRSSM